METASLGNNRIIEECRALLSKKKISEDDSDIFIQIVEGVLSDYEDYLGGDQEIRYNVLKRFDRVECKIFVKAEKSDPFDEGKGAEERRRIKTVGNVMNNRDASLLYRYSHGYNIVTVRSAKKTGSGNILKQPMVQAALGGLILGLICQQLPVGLNHFIVNKITSPILTISLDVMAGIMGPVVFFSIVKAVSILDDIDALTGLGSRVMKRFLILALCITVICNLVGVVFFPLFGKGNAGYSPGIIIELLLDVIPTSLVVPFVENNIP